MGRRTNTFSEPTYPLVTVQRFQSLKCEVDTRQLEDLARYIKYAESATGQKPTEGEVIGAALAELFKLDRGFQKWKDRQENPSLRTISPAALSTGD